MAGVACVHVTVGSESCCVRRPMLHTPALLPHCRYVRGDVRFSSKYSKGNPRKMVATWAEKEMRNLHRLAAAGVPCPRARARRKHVLVMDFVGTNGIAAPRLKVGWR